MTTIDEHYAAFLHLRQLQVTHRKEEPVISVEAKKALEERKIKLLEAQERKAYKDMTKNVASEKYKKEDEYGQIWKEMNRQGTAVFNTLITVGGAFTFAYYGAPMMVPSLDLTGSVICGLILATIVFIADLYFIMKDM
uniref:Uncharacterized protein n=1 Tax=Panagrolaimus superbus TaxID=310955 RepID=A0A914YE62_9BILA